MTSTIKFPNLTRLATSLLGPNEKGFDHYILSLTHNTLKMKRNIQHNKYGVRSSASFSLFVNLISFVEK